MNIRKITSMTMLLSFILCILTSIILYIVPQGRVAYWADWHLWGMTKGQWGDLHINLGLLLLIAGFLHIFYNWKVIVAYMKNRAREVKVFTGSFNVALMLCLIVGLGTFYEIPPVYSVISFSDSIKDTAAEKYGEPPYGHAELSSLKSFTKKVDIDLTNAKELLSKAGVVITGDNQTIGEIAAGNNLSPKEVHAIMVAAQNNDAVNAAFPEEPFPGFGRKVLADICKKYNIDITTTIERLARENITAEADQTIKEIASSADMDPYAFFEVLHRVATE
jgi:hypothetical protein